MIKMKQCQNCDNIIYYKRTLCQSCFDRRLNKLNKVNEK